MYILLEEGEVELAFEGWTWLSGRKAIAFLKGNNVRKSIEGRIWKSSWQQQKHRIKWKAHIIVGITWEKKIRLK